MRILYGIQGTGNGHLARARALVPALLHRKLDVDFVFSGRAREDYFNMDLFGDFASFKGLSLITERGQLKHWQTMRRNNVPEFFRDLNKVNAADYDLVISDFEPVTAWAARKAGVRSVGISHQNAFRYAVPKVSGYLGSRLILQRFAPTTLDVGLHWHHFNEPVLPPLIEALSGERVIGNKILVYMGFEDVQDIVDFVTPCSDFQFLIYARVESPRDLGHVQIRPLSHTEFHRDLQDCAGVISNAGFELSSECLALGKKLLIKPLLGQYEQLCNALALQSLNRGTVIESLDTRVLEKWLQLPGHPPIPYPDVAATLADWIVDGCRASLTELTTSLWSDIDLPLDYDRRFGRSLMPGLIS